MIANGKHSQLLGQERYRVGPLPGDHWEEAPSEGWNEPPLPAPDFPPPEESAPVTPPEAFPAQPAEDLGCLGLVHCLWSVSW